MPRAIIIALSSFIVFMAPVRAEVLRVIEMDQPNSRLVPSNRPNVGPQIIDVGPPVSTTYDTGTIYRIWRADEAFRGKHSIGLRIEKENRPQNPKSKIEINVSRHDDPFGNLKNNTERYLGFALKLDPIEYEAPSRWVLLFQVWQCCSFQPPLALQEIPSKRPDDPLRFIFIRRENDNLFRAETHDNGTRTKLADSQDSFILERGRWYRFILRLRPGIDQNAGYTAWIDGRLLLDYNGPWGYTGNEVTNSYIVKLGIYRHAQQTRQQVYFDSIRWGTSKDDVDPDRH